MGMLKVPPKTVTVERVAKIDGDKGHVQQVRFTATYNRHSSKKALEINDQLLKGEITDEQLMAEDLVDWTMPGVDGEPVECTAENVEQAMQFREYRKELVDGWFLVQHGREALARKNGSTPGVTGQ